MGEGGVGVNGKGKLANHPAGPSQRCRWQQGRPEPGGHEAVPTPARRPPKAWRRGRLSPLPGLRHRQRCLTFLRASPPLLTRPNQGGAGRAAPAEREGLQFADAPRAQAMLRRLPQGPAPPRCAAAPAQVCKRLSDVRDVCGGRTRSATEGGRGWPPATSSAAGAVSDIRLKQQAGPTGRPARSPRSDQRPVAAFPRPGGRPARQPGIAAGPGEAPACRSPAFPEGAPPGCSHLGPDNDPLAVSLLRTNPPVGHSSSRPFQGRRRLPGHEAGKASQLEPHSTQRDVVLEQLPKGGCCSGDSGSRRAGGGGGRVVLTVWYDGNALLQIHHFTDT